MLETNQDMELEIISIIRSLGAKLLFIISERLIKINKNIGSIRHDFRIIKIGEIN